MPSSDPRSLGAVMHRIVGIMPHSVLDLGIGYGKYGALCREYADFNREEQIYRGPSDWQVSIIGVEGFEKYRNPLWRLYDLVKIEDFSTRELWEGYQGFDLVLLLDSLEHLEESVAADFLRHLVAKNSRVIVATPEGDYAQGPMCGNDLESHRSVWTSNKLEEFGGEVFYRGEICIAAEFHHA